MDKNPEQPVGDEAYTLFLDDEADRLTQDGAYVTVERVMDERVKLPAPIKIQILFSDETQAISAVQEVGQRLDVNSAEPKPELQNVKPGFTKVLSGYGGQDTELSFAELESPRHPATAREWSVTLRGIHHKDQSKPATFGPNTVLYLREKGWLLPIEIMEDGERLNKFLSSKGINVPYKS